MSAAAWTVLAIGAAGALGAAAYWRAKQAANPPHADGPRRSGGVGRLSRRRFLLRTAMAGLGLYAGTSAMGIQSAAATSPREVPRHRALDPEACGVICTVISCTGCACAGNLYHCVGCGRDEFACIAGHACTTFCYPPC